MYNRTDEQTFISQIIPYRTYFRCSSVEQTFRCGTQRTNYRSGDQTYISLASETKSLLRANYQKLLRAVSFLPWNLLRVNSPFESTTCRLLTQQCSLPFTQTTTCSLNFEVFSGVCIVGGGFFYCSLQENEQFLILFFVTIVTDGLGDDAMGYPERHVRKASHRGSKQQQRSRVAISLTIACSRYIYNGVVLHAHPVRGESHNQRNTTGEVATTSPPFCNDRSRVLCVKVELGTTFTSWSQHHFVDVSLSLC